MKKRSLQGKSKIRITIKIKNRKLEYGKESTNTDTVAEADE